MSITKLFAVIMSALCIMTSGCQVNTENNIEGETEMIQEYTPLSNTYYRLTNDKELNVAFLGGSITQGQGASKYDNNYVSLATKWLSDSFPEAKVNANNAGISNTGSNYGIFRLEDDILNVAVPDLLFIEYTSNDWGRFGELNISRQNESIIRMLYEANPKMDIMFIFTSFSHEGHCRKASIDLAKHYGLIAVDPGSILKTRIDTEEGGDYSKYSADKIHPNDTGYAFYNELISEQFQKYLIDEAPEKAQYTDISLPEPLNDSGLFLNPEMLSPILFDYEPDFEYSDKTLTMRNKKYDHMITTDKEGAEFTFTFDGTGFGLLVYKTPTVSSIEYSVDGGEFIPYDIGDMHNYNHGQMYIMEHDLEKGEHTVVIRNVASKYGTTLNIVKVCVNK